MPSIATAYTLKYCSESIVPMGESVSTAAAKGTTSSGMPLRHSRTTIRAKSSTCAVHISMRRSP